MYELIIKKVIRGLKGAHSMYSDDYPNLWCDFITQVQEQKFFNWYEYEILLKRSIHGELTDLTNTEIEMMWDSLVDIEDDYSPILDQQIDELTDIICEKIYDEACDSELEEEIEVVEGDNDNDQHKLNFM